MIMKVIKISNLAIIWMVNLKFYRELKNSLYNVIFMIMTQVIRLVPTHPGQHDKTLLFFREFRKHSVRLCSGVVNSADLPAFTSVVETDLPDLPADLPPSSKRIYRIYQRIYRIYLRRGERIYRIYRIYRRIYRIYLRRQNGFTGLVVADLPDLLPSSKRIYRIRIFFCFLTYVGNRPLIVLILYPWY